jgi:hypothetical protein
MDDVHAPATARAVEASTEDADPGIEIVRDIARGGLAGLVVGFVVAGIGSRLAMRVAALLVPQATGLTTENGFPIGRITLEGSLGLLIFGGVAATVFLAATWVVISPWLPRQLGRRALVTIPIAIAFGTSALVDARNPDFSVLRREPLVVTTLVLLIAALGPAMTVVDAWLDRVLPRPASWSSGAAMGYASLSAIGALLATALVLQAALDPRGRAFGLTMLVLGGCTLAWWVARTRGDVAPGRSLQRAAWVVLTAGTLFGLASLLPDIRGALGWR